MTVKIDYVHGLYTNNYNIQIINLNDPCFRFFRNILIVDLYAKNSSEIGRGIDEFMEHELIKNNITIKPRQTRNILKLFKELSCLKRLSEN